MCLKNLVRPSRRPLRLARSSSPISHSDTRSQFIRLFFEATGTPYVDTALTEGQSAVKPYLDGSFDGAGTVLASCGHFPCLP